MSDESPDESLGVVGSLIESTPDIFQNRSVVTTSVIPDEDRIVGREEQIETVVQSLSDLVRGDAPDDLSIFGWTGTGKSLTARFVTQRIKALAKDNGVNIAAVYVNCSRHDTKTRVAKAIYFDVYDMLDDTPLSLSDYDDVDAPVGFSKLPQSGISFDKYITGVENLLEEFFDGSIIILDEIDILKELSPLFHELSRFKESPDFSTPMSIITISNKIRFQERFDERVQSSFSPANYVFKPYSAEQLEEILRRREDAFHDGVLEEGIIEHVADLAAEDHGDARKAINLLNKAGLVARKQRSQTVTTDHVDQARVLVETELLQDLVTTCSTQQKYILYSLTRLEMLRSNESDYEGVSTNAIRERYEDLVVETDEDPVGYQRHLDLLDELEFYEITDSQRKGRGYKQGMSRYHQLNHDPEVVLGALLAEEPILQDLEGTLPDDTIIPSEYSLRSV